MATEFRLKQWLEKRDISQGELSRQSGVSLSTVNRIATNSTTRVDLETLDRLAVVLDCKPGDLVGRVGSGRRTGRRGLRAL